MKTETTTTKPAFDPEVPPREGFIFYRTFYEALASMKNRARLHLYDVIMRYASLRRGTDGSQRRADANLHTDPSPAGCQRTETASKVQKRRQSKRITTKNSTNFSQKPKTKKMTIYEYSTIYNMNRSLLKDNSNMKENEYDNGYIERQTVSSNPRNSLRSGSPCSRTTSHRNHSAMLT